MQHLNTQPRCTILVLLLVTLTLAACDDEPTPGADAPEQASLDAEASPSETAEESEATEELAVDESEATNIYHLRSDRLDEFSTDAVLDEDFWLQAPTIRLQPAQQARHQHSMVHLLWSDDALLIGARLQSDHMLASRDRLSIYLQPGDDAPWTRLELSPGEDADLFSLRDDQQESIDASSVESTTDFDGESTTGFWIVEARLPLESIADAPDSWPEASWRGDLSRVDYSPNEAARYYTVDGTHSDAITPQNPQTWTMANAVEDEVEMRDYDPDLDPSLLQEMETQPPAQE